MEIRNRGSTKDQITREQAIEFGNKYLKKLLGENADKMKLESCDLKPNQCELYYCQYIEITRLNTIQLLFRLTISEFIRLRLRQYV